MIVEIVYNEGDEKTTELISIKSFDFDKLKEISKKYSEEEYHTFFKDYLKENGLQFLEIKPEETIEV